jgi:proline iminopeptidase
MRVRPFLSTVAAAACLSTPPLVPPTVDEDPSLPALALRDSKFHVVIEGAAAGTPLVFLAGGPGNDALYLRRLGQLCDGADLGRDHPLVFWDQRGTGRSRRHDAGDLNLATFEADLVALIDHLDPEGRGVVLVGHSWGGMLATSYVNAHPSRVRGLILLEPGEYSSAIWDAWLAASGASDSFRVNFAAEWLNDFAWSAQVLTLHDHEALDFAALVAAKGAQPERIDREQAPIDRLGAAVTRSNLLGTFYPDTFDFTTNLAAYRREVLVVAGDTPTSDLGVDFQRFQLDTFPNATLHVLPGAGHTDVAWADACATSTAIGAYLSRVLEVP